MTKPSLRRLLLLLVLHSTIASFGRRGSDSPVKKDLPPAAAGHWSSTGFSGLDHETHERKIQDVKRVKKTSSTSTKAAQDIHHDHPDYHFLEHHPYASGVFTLDPTLGFI
jgi:hypothetical protein